MTIQEFQERLDRARRDNERINLNIHQMNVDWIDDYNFEDIGYSWDHVLSMYISAYSVHFKIIENRGFLYIEHGYTDEVTESKKFTLENGVRRYDFIGW